MKMDLMVVDGIGDVIASHTTAMVSRKIHYTPAVDFILYRSVISSNMMMTPFTLRSATHTLILIL